MKDAKEVIREALTVWGLRNRPDEVAEQVLADLTSSGHLRTGIEREAVEACEKYAVSVGATSARFYGPVAAVAKVGRRSLDEKRPKLWRPANDGQPIVLDPDGRWFATFRTDDAAAAYVEQKNGGGK